MLHWSQPVLLSLGSELRAWAVCSCLSIGFVGSLYLLPARVRALRRHDPVQASEARSCAQKYVP
jgi:hypothetical protein